MPRTSAVQPIDGGGGFTIESHPPNVGAEHRSTVRLYMSNRGRGRLTGAGFSAVLGVVNAYLTSSKCAAIQTRAGSNASVQCDLACEGLAIDILPEDATTLAASLTAVVNVAANVAT